MGWKGWPYWVKGVAITFGFLLVLTLITIVIGSIMSSIPFLMEGNFLGPRDNFSPIAKFFYDSGIKLFSWGWKFFIFPANLLSVASINIGGEMRTGPGAYLTIPIINISHILVSLLFWFIIGALIGWIYGKIKNRNK